jgi:hypothetical protein
MNTTICDKLASYFTSLAATNTICSSFGAAFTFGTNLFIGADNAEASQCLVIIPYGGSMPSDQDKQNPSVQIAVKSKSRRTAMSTCQALINILHRNDSTASKTFILANNSCPIMFGTTEGGESVIAVSNYTIKHVKF